MVKSDTLVSKDKLNSFGFATTTLRKPSFAKFVEKKSSFTAYFFPITSENELKTHLLELKKKHKDASHFPYALRISTTTKDDSQLKVFEKYSDDGEPSKTAGLPLLRHLQQKNLVNVLVIVARVFGGVKLGPSGLMRAFVHSLELAINNAELSEEELSFTEIVKTDMYHFSRLEVFLKQQNLFFEKQFDLSGVELRIHFPFSKKYLLDEVLRLV